MKWHLIHNLCVENCKALDEKTHKCSLYDCMCEGSDKCLLKCIIRRVQEFKADVNVLCDLVIFDIEEEDYL